VRRVRARNARDLELEALDARLAAADPETYAGMIRWAGQGRAFFTREPAARLARLAPPSLLPT
jgi:hypothetical protein